MVDGHIHINKAPFSLDTIKEFIRVAKEKNIDTLYILDHTHKFKEFIPIYSHLDDYTKEVWFNKKEFISIYEYLDFIKLCKSVEWDIKLYFGLEVCYNKVIEKELKNILNSLPKFDFLIGSVHFVNGVGIDINKEYFSKFDIDEMYLGYFNELQNSIDSKLFDFIGHPDLIKLFGFVPSFDLKPFYERLAKSLKMNNQMTENNSGLIRYGFPYPGLNKDLLDSLLKEDVKFHKSSDAHKAEDIGRVFDDLIDNL